MNTISHISENLQKILLLNQSEIPKCHQWCYTVFLLGQSVKQTVTISDSELYIHCINEHFCTHLHLLFATSTKVHLRPLFMLLPCLQSLLLHTVHTKDIKKHKRYKLRELDIFGHSL